MPTEYFSHDYNARNDRKMVAFLSEFKACGYGIYWGIVEMLHEEGGYLPMDQITYIAIAKSFEVDVEKVKQIIEKCVNDYSLLFEKDGKFTSNRVLRNTEKRNEIREIKSKAGKISAQNRLKLTHAKHKSTDVQQQLNGVEHNPTNKRKVKESKGNKRSKEVTPYGVVASGEATERAEYENFVQENQAKDEKEVYSGLKDFISEKKPSIAEPYVHAWNIVATKNNLPKVSEITSDRRDKIRLRTREPAFDFFKILASIRQNKFYTGENNNDWKATFNFVVKSEKNYIEIIEKYKER